MPDSQKWLAEYIRTGSETAFKQLVTSYIDFVYSTAVRCLRGNTGLAEDVTQTVFLDLATKARAFDPGVMLGGWLHKHTCFVASKTARAEQRRAHREKEAVQMSECHAQTEAISPATAAILDEVIEALDAVDRTAVLLRFFERLDFRTVGQKLGMSEDGARMRVNRALAKLHTLLEQRGVTVSALALAAWLEADAVSAAPAALAEAVARQLATAKAGIVASSGLFQKMIGAITLKTVAVSTVVLLLAVSAGQYWLNSSRAAKHIEPPAGIASNPSGTANGQRGSRPENAPAYKALSADELDLLKAELRGVLARSRAVQAYPPAELEAALRKFGQQWTESVPVLLTHVDSFDFQTRKWALYGIWDFMVNAHAWKAVHPADKERADELVQPALARVFRSEQEPVELRRVAVQAMLMRVQTGGAEWQPPPLGPGTLSNVVAVLQSSDKDSEGLRFEIVSPYLLPYLKNSAEAAPDVQEAATRLLKENDFSKRFLGAFIFAQIPSTPSNEAKTVLVEALERTGTREGLYSYRAADALGLLGPEAEDALPALLLYAEKTMAYKNGSAEHAQEAACRIEPALRAKYPDIDAKLRQEELARQGMISGQRETLQGATEARKSAPPAQESSSAPPLSLEQLLVDARVLLLEYKTPQENRLHELPNQWHAYYRSRPSEAVVTSPRFKELSQSIHKIDPGFQEVWLKTVLKNSPDLDRVVRPVSK